MCLSDGTSVVVVVHVPEGRLRLIRDLQSQATKLAKHHHSGRCHIVVGSKAPLKELCTECQLAEREAIQPEIPRYTLPTLVNLPSLTMTELMQCRVVVSAEARQWVTQRGASQRLAGSFKEAGVHVLPLVRACQAL
eukprot:Transcript_5820.p2 GENE.Transcript_5820~~Transcript_5820.p2  ORF type:complete len:136 (+),score=0.38 Transcript_5820:147-554(+)